MEVNDYTHDDAMRDLETLMDGDDELYELRIQAANDIRAYIERLEAAVDVAEADYRRARSQLQIFMDKVDDLQQERDEWEAVARWLAGELEAWRKRQASEWIAAAQEAVRHE